MPEARFDFDSCEALHREAWARVRYCAPIDWGALPPEGMYCLFEHGEVAHRGDRIVCVGTHVVGGGLPARLRKHFEGNRHVSILRKHVGAALLRRDGCADNDVVAWEDGAGSFDWVEAWLSTYLRNAFSFAVMPAELEAQKREQYEQAWIQMLFDCDLCAPGEDWLGQYSSNRLIAASGLWNVLHVGSSGAQYAPSGM